MRPKQKSLKHNYEENNQDELENYKIEKFEKSLNPEEELSNVFKHLIFKTNTKIIKYPKVRN